MFSQKELLRVEIDFWRDMIDRQEREYNTPASERMQQALALAERKLLMLEPNAPEPDSGTGNRTNPFSASGSIN